MMAIEAVVEDCLMGCNMIWTYPMEIGCKATGARILFTIVIAMKWNMIDFSAPRLFGRF
jgi:hypothetical protein